MIKDLLKNKSAKEKAKIKGREIAKVDFRGKYIKDGIKIEIIEINAIEDGVEVFARAWKGKKQLGFGKDGSVDIERFCFINPPILVSDSNGDVIREWTDLDKVVKQSRFREDPAEAIRQDLVHTISISTSAKLDTNIVEGKIGSTHTVFRPAAGANSPVDGAVVKQDSTNWATTHDATTGQTANDTNTTMEVLCDKANAGGTLFRVSRAIVLFDISSIDASDTLDSITMSLWGVTIVDNQNDLTGIVQSSPASDAAVATGDYDAYTSIDQDTATSTVDITSQNTGEFNEFSFDSTGIGWADVVLDGDGIFKLGVRCGLDFQETSSHSNPPTTAQNGVIYSSADHTGITQDPKLVIVHTAAVTFIPSVMMF